MRHDPPLTFWPKRGGVLAATRNGYRYRVEPMGHHWLCTVTRSGGHASPVLRNRSMSSAAAVSWLTATAAEIEAGNRSRKRGRITPTGWRS